MAQGQLYLSSNSSSNVLRNRTSDVWAMTAQYR